MHREPYRGAEILGKTSLFSAFIKLVYLKSSFIMDGYTQLSEFPHRIIRNFVRLNLVINIDLAVISISH